MSSRFKLESLNTKSAGCADVVLRNEHAEEMGIFVGNLLNTPILCSLWAVSTCSLGVQFVPLFVHTALCIRGIEQESSNQTTKVLSNSIIREKRWRGNRRKMLRGEQVERCPVAVVNRACHGLLCLGHSL